MRTLLPASAALLLLLSACENDEAAVSPSGGSGGAGSSAADCTTTADEDGDGAPGCADSDCARHPTCTGGFEASCTDGRDDDADGATDCQDADCDQAPSCVVAPESACADGRDDDGDGLTDCADGDCVFAPGCCADCGELCDNAVDDDGDGALDCADADCADEPSCGSGELCAGGIDEDGDGLTDCGDPDCAASQSCPQPERCTGGVDEDRDGAVDCDDPDCRGGADCPLEQCAGGVDEDRDGLTDCGDPDCEDFPACAAREQLCNDGRDDDGDGFTDCRDADCSGDPACIVRPPEDCAALGDEDVDGLADCADPDCARLPACAPTEDCGNGIDDDGDSFIDCDDFFCAADVRCVRVELCAAAGDEDGDGEENCADSDCFAEAACAQVVSAGDLVFTELMPDPGSGAGDPANEWFELHNRTAGPIDLAGFGISDLDGSPVRRHVIARSVLVPAGAFVVLAHSADAALGFTPAYLYGATAISLANAGDQLELTDRAGVRIDLVDWSVAAFPSPQAGSSLETAARDATSNDDPTQWCRSAAATFNAAGEHGTPAAAGACGGPVLPREPAAGELVFSEVLYNPAGAEPNAEWIEVANVAAVTLDLSNLLLSSGASVATLPAGLTLAGGARIVLCRTAVAGPAGCTPYSAISLTNTGDELSLTRGDGTVLDTVIYDDVAPWPASTNGASIELSEAHLTATANNDGTRWCLGTAAAGAELGTPGARNSCP